MPSQDVPETKEEELERYDVVLSEQAADDLRDTALAFKKRRFSVKNIERFADGFEAEIDSLAILPHRYEIFPRESRLLQVETRRLLYISKSPSASYHAFYSVDELAKQVTIIHIRSAVRRPLTFHKAKEVLANQ